MDITSVRKFPGAGHGDYSFVVHSTDRDMLLRADTANDESRWIRGLTLQIDLVHGGTFQGPPSAKNRRRTVLRLMHERGGSESGISAGSDAAMQQHRHGEWEGSHFKEVNARIRAIMNDRDDDASAENAPVSGPAWLTS